MGKAVVILSGGLDSTTLLYDVINNSQYKVSAITFDYGQKHSKEIGMAVKTAQRLGIEHRVVDCSILGDLAPSALTRKCIDIPEGHYQDKTMKKTVVPNRNMVLIALAAAHAISIKATALYYGAHAGDHAIYPDCRPEFVTAMQAVLKLCDYQAISLHAPYLMISKSQIVKTGLALHVDYSSTWTCYQGGDLACGVCGSCTERLEAFHDNQAIDPLKYATTGLTAEGHTK